MSNQPRSQINLSESEPEIWPQDNAAGNGGSGLTGLHPPPVKTARLSAEASVKRTPTARRYGSIRVAECSFIEAESQASTPSASICEIDSSAASVAYTGVGIPPYRGQHRHQYSTYTAAGLRSPASPSLPPPPKSPPPPPAASGPLCNGPLSLALSEFRSATSTSGGGNHTSEGPNGQHSHIIPPPQNFSNGDYAPLTTTRIGSSLNLTSRPPPHPSRQQPHHQTVVTSEASSFVWPHQKYRGQDDTNRTDSF